MGSSVVHTSTLGQLLIYGPGLGTAFGSRAQKVRNIAEAGRRCVSILGFGVIKGGNSYGQGEEKAGEWVHMCQLDQGCTADDICAGKKTPTTATIIC